MDILQTPVAAQTGRLATLWQHTLRKLHKKSAADSGRSASTNTTSGAGSTAAEAQECSEGDDLVKAILPDLFETALWEQHDLAGISAMDGSSVDTPDTPDICHRLSQVCSTSAATILFHTDHGSGCALNLTGLPMLANWNINTLGLMLSCINQTFATC